MSLHMGLIMVRADVRADMREILEMFDDRPVASTPAQTWQAALATVDLLNHKSRELVCKVVAYCNGWTVILDPELVMFTDEGACSNLSLRYGAPVFAMVCEGASGSYAFSIFKPGIQRAYSISDREVIDDRGDPLPEETGIDLAQLFEDDVLLIMQRLGVSYQDLECCDSFDIWELDESHLAPAQQASEPQPRKPWWKFW